MGMGASVSRRVGRTWAVARRQGSIKDRFDRGKCTVRRSRDGTRSLHRLPCPEPCPEHDTFNVIEAQSKKALPLFTIHRVTSTVPPPGQSSQLPPSLFRRHRRL
jgi:hypothetical protein